MAKRFAKENRRDKESPLPRPIATADRWIILPFVNKNSTDVSAAQVEQVCQFFVGATLCTRLTFKARTRTH